MNQEQIIEQIQDERKKQDDKWGEQDHHPLKWLAILGEEVGEANRAMLEEKLIDYRKELIQVAAVAVAAVESLYRKEWRFTSEHDGGFVVKRAREDT
jgi:NTP pyrophosphatase (non-canonical NTP hydrolase)